MSEIVSIDFENRKPLAGKTELIGREGERLAARFLHRNGYALVLSNFKVAIGRNRLGVQVTGEIDLIALDGDILCFIEVKTRSSDDFASPLSAIDLRKQRQITRTARVYRKIFGLQKMKFRYDAVAIVLMEKKSPKIEVFKGFWSEAKFRKKNWADEF